VQRNPSPRLKSFGGAVLSPRAAPSAPQAGGAGELALRAGQPMPSMRQCGNARRTGGSARAQARGPRALRAAAALP